MPTLIKFLRKPTTSELTLRDYYTHAVSIALAVNTDLKGRFSAISEQPPQFTANLDGQGFYFFTQARVIPNYLPVIQGILTKLNLADTYELSYNPPGVIARPSMTTRFENILTVSDKRRQIKSCIPDEMLCPLLGQIMDEPVRLPSGKIVEKSAIILHLQSAPTDPFSRAPLTLEQCETDLSLKHKIMDYVFNSVSFGLAEKINPFITTDPIRHQQGYFQREGNPYGHDAQRYDRPFPITFFKTGCVVTKNNAHGRVISQVRKEIALHSMNYPDPSKTTLALRDLFHATLNGDMDTADKIRACYPVLTKRFMFELQLRCGINISISPGVCSLPLDFNDSYFAEPHRESITEICSLI